MRKLVLLAAAIALAATAAIAQQGNVATVGGGGAPSGAAGGALSGTYPNPGLATMVADTVLANASGSTASPSAVALGSCSAATSALTYNTTSHAFGCNTITGGVTSVFGRTGAVVAATSDYTYAQIAAGNAAGTIATGLTIAAGSTNTLAATSEVLNANLASVPTPIAGVGMVVSPPNGAVGRYQANGYNAIGAFTVARYAGTAASPTAVQANDQLGGFNAYAYDGTTLDGPIASFRSYATDTITSAHWGSKSCIATSATNTVTMTDKFCVDQAGALTGSTSLVLNGATIGSDVLSVLGSATISSISTGFLNVTASTAATNGINLNAANQLGFYTNSGVRMTLTSGGNLNSASASGFMLAAGNASATGPTLLPNKAATTTGIGAQASGNMSEIVGGAEVGRWTSTGLNNANIGATTAGTGAFAGLTATSSFTATGLVTNADLATMATNTILGNATSGSASPTALAIASCSASTSALTWTTNTGFGCNTVTATGGLLAANNLSDVSNAATSLTNLGAAPAGLVSIITTSQAPTAAMWAACKTYTVNAGSLTITVPATSTLATNGCLFISTLNAVTLAPNAADAINGGTTGASLSIAANQTVEVTTDGGGNLYVANSTGGGLTVGSTAIASGTTTRILYDNAGTLGEYTLSGSGTVVAMATSPSFTTPTLGVATATSINKLTITAPATSATLTIPDGVTLNAGAGGTLASAAFVATGTSGATIPLLNGANTWSGIQTNSVGVVNTYAGAASLSAQLFSGAVYISGTGTTNFPQVMFQPTGTTAATSWATTGTVVGFNEGTSGITILDSHVAGGATTFNVTAGGDIFGNSLAVKNNAFSSIGVSGRAYFLSPATNSMGCYAANATTPCTFIAGVVQTVPLTVSMLPAAATAGAGARAYVTDATTCLFLGSLTGGGSTKCPVISDGSAWAPG